MLKVGSVIDGKYKVLHQIGKGGMSFVYLCINVKANKQWAVKEVKKNGNASSEAIRQSLLTEASILKKLRHQHLPSIIDVIDQDDTYLILMDYVEGRTLKTILDERGALPQDKVVDWTIQLCSVFSYLHGQNPPIIYRDMKPANIMLRPDGNVVLIDFGTAREYKEGREEDTKNLGTRGYAAPEQFGQLGQTDARTDIFNLGVTMYQLVTGKNPTKPPYEIRPIRDWDPSLSSGLEKIIIKCTRPNPDDRYQSADELQFALEHYRELETDFIHAKKKGIKRLIVTAALTAVMLSSSAFCKLHANSVLNSTYTEKIRQAQVSADEAERIECYEYAIKLDPRKEDAYNELLSEVFLADGTFTKDEAEEMTKLLGYKGTSDTRSVEDRFSGNPVGYDGFCFQMGLAYFYYYEDTGNKQLSKPWFGTAKDSDTLPTEKTERAKRFFKIANYYVQLNNQNKAGDNTISYKDYWGDLLILSNGDIAREDNIRTALVVYKELTYQIGAHAMEFHNAGISKEDMQAELTMVEEKIQEMENFGNYDDYSDGVFISDITTNIASAKNTLDNVFADVSNREKGGGIR